MEQENRISVWFGKFDSQSSFEKYVKESYDDDGEMTSKFMVDFGIDFYDTDFSESLFIEDGDVTKLHDFSYSDSFLDKILEKISDENSFLIIYNFSYEALLSSNHQLKFLGSFLL